MRVLCSGWRLCASVAWFFACSRRDVGPSSAGGGSAVIGADCAMETRANMSKICDIDCDIDELCTCDRCTVEGERVRVERSQRKRGVALCL